MPVETKPGCIARLESAGAVHATSAEARTVRLEHGKPRYGEDIFDTTLPQETQQMHAVHFSKGCYIGQEIVERIRSRGRVNRLLVKLEVEGVAPFGGRDQRLPLAPAKLGRSRHPLSRLRWARWSRWLTCAHSMPPMGRFCRRADGRRLSLLNAA